MDEKVEDEEERKEEKSEEGGGVEVPRGLQLLPYPGLLMQLVGVQLRDHPQGVRFPGAEK